MVILRDIAVSLDPLELKRRLRMEQGGEWNQVQALADYAQPLITAKIAYKVCYIESKLEDTIAIDGIRLKSRVLQKNVETS